MSNILLKSLMKKIIHAIYIFFGLIPLFILLFVTVFFVLYLIKSLIGIDIFPDGHLWDLL